MKIYLINITLIFLYACMVLYKPRYRNKKLFCTLASFNWILISGLRHISIGNDTRIYKLFNFDRTLNLSWTDVLNNFINIYFYGDQGKDPGYMIFEKVAQILTKEYQVFLFIIAIIFTFSLGNWIYKNSSEPFISFLIYSTLFFSFFAITGHRQTIATALVVLVGYKYIKEREIYKFLILIAIAFTIHKSSIVFLLFYFLANKKITKRYLSVSLVITASAFIFRYQLMSVLSVVTGYDVYNFQYEGAGTWTFTLLLIMILGITIWKHKEIISNNHEAKHYINAMIIALWLVPLTFINPSTMRAVQYYSIFLMLLVPDIIRSFHKDEKVIVYYVSMSTLILLFVRNNPNYLFFWQ